MCNCEMPQTLVQSKGGEGVGRETVCAMTLNKPVARAVQPSTGIDSHFGRPYAAAVGKLVPRQLMNWLSIADEQEIMHRPSGLCQAAAKYLP